MLIISAFKISRLADLNQICGSKHMKEYWHFIFILDFAGEQINDMDELLPDKCLKLILFYRTSD